MSCITSHLLLGPARKAERISKQLSGAQVQRCISHSSSHCVERAQIGHTQGDTKQFFIINTGWERVWVAGALLRERRMMMLRESYNNMDVYKGLWCRYRLSGSICIDFFLRREQKLRACMWELCLRRQLTTTARVYSECWCARRVCRASCVGRANIWIAFYLRSQDERKRTSRVGWKLWCKIRQSAHEVREFSGFKI